MNNWRPLTRHLSLSLLFNNFQSGHCFNLLSLYNNFQNCKKSAKAKLTSKPQASLKSVAFTVTSCYSCGILINLYFYFSSSGPVLVGAPVSTAHDFNHSLEPSIEDPPLHGMPEPSLYGLQTQSTIGGDPHCFSGSTSSTVPFLPGTPGFLPPMMGVPLHGLQTQSTIPGVTQSSGSVMTTVTHPPGILGYVSSHGMQSSLLPNMQSGCPVISEHTQNTDSPCHKSGTSPLSGVL